MTLSKMAQADKQISDSSKRLQEATDTAYSSLIDLYLVAEEHLNLMQHSAAQVGARVAFDGLRVNTTIGEEMYQAWPGHMHTESVVNHVLQTHRILGHSAWSRVELPIPDRRIPAPTGADLFIR